MENPINDNNSLFSLKSDDIEIMINDQADEATEELFQPLLFRYQIRLEISIRASDFILDCVHLFY